MIATLSVRGMGKMFGHAPVLHDVALDAGPGDLVVVTGASDSGRSSLLRCLGGTYRPGTGTVHLTLGDGSLDLVAASARELAWVRQHHLAVFDVPLVASPSESASVAVARTARIGPQAAEDALRRLCAHDVAHVPLGRLRKQQRRTAALAAALASDRPVILADEPESAGPPDVILSWLAQRRAAGAAAVVSSVFESPLLEHATHTVHLQQGARS